MNNHTDHNNQTSGDPTDDTISELDVSGLICPLPVLRARKSLMALQSGALLRVLCTDPAAASDFPAFCLAAGHDLIRSEQTDGDQGPELTFLIRRGG